MEERLLLILNPCAGQKRANHLLTDMVRILNNCGFECCVYVTESSGDATEYVRKHANEYARIIAVGGDGTLNETIAGLVEAGADCPVGYIPAGTTNDYAASVGLSTDIMRAAEDAAKGQAHEFDLGSFNGRHFIYTASCGAFAKASYTTPQLAKNMMGHLAYILEGIKDLYSIKPIHMRVCAEDAVYEDNYLFCAITNSISLGGVLKLDPKDVNLSDGQFEVMLIKMPATPIQLTQILRAITTKNLSCEMIDFFTASRVDIETEEDVEWTLDGERGECGRNFEAVNLHKRMKLILPENVAIKG